ncbi:hypothetical protein F5878DRAFT_618567 [Lentinula raphanica]|uniref:Postreplication repair E3 ubiquitin-protein ligase RAD18 n=1 Tax=Lentinula raphanica TaxID=153919 RepID=A0AA38P9G7_9AGAR|nr:hypothetical protein F5880DRAFT_899677 [Lentinula raphanica]KAJ3838779.1 hypothetical protein F5878DRAFT_618567 [Lentinula raphanica]
MARGNQIQQLMSDVQDPSDFPPQSEVPGLRLLDSSLRCTICSEFFDGPVTLKCGHCFCSLCIRESLSEKHECPACREDDVDIVHLRKNPAMEEVVNAWKQCRSHLLQIVNDSRGHVDSSSPSKKRKRTDESRSATLTDPSTTSDSSTLTDFVNCPMCDKRVKYEDINSHMDKSCKDEPAVTLPSSKLQWDNILGAKSQVKSSKKRGKERASSLEEETDYPLPSKSYDTLKDKQVRELLSEHDLPTTGDRKTIIARHQRWVTIYNANLDKTLKMRKSLSILRRDLRDWETQQKNKTKHDIEDPTAYQIKQKSEFDMLIEAARPKGTPKSNSVTSVSNGHKVPSNRSGSTTKNSSPSVHGGFVEAIVVDSDGES